MISAYDGLYVNAQRIATGSDLQISYRSPGTRRRDIPISSNGVPGAVIERRAFYECLPSSYMVSNQHQRSSKDQHALKCPSSYTSAISSQVRTTYISFQFDIKLVSLLVQLFELLLESVPKSRRWRPKRRARGLLFAFRRHLECSYVVRVGQGQQVCLWATSTFRDIMSFPARESPHYVKTQMSSAKQEDEEQRGAVLAGV